ncbi:TolC family protein [Antarcticibacterium sp. 1MA-6-2]|uniref:TolC family protein n=1 Tax=Antarcticibacterium sp. 1MA-6-2 TaxID=2908210 RepID=UPI001F1C920E|nr:TolC family protein [Antarcticibacterium sp. 1MA-6-2]UJH92140.1 TolC family protein [Antarcticibacterium sp. 1MA-6-2]
MNKLLSFSILFLFVFNSQSQELLTVEEAVKIALENNFQIRLASNELEIDQTQVSIGNAGMLPTVGIAGTTNSSIQNSSQTRADGNLIELDDARNNNINYGVVMDWTIFDGFRMFARHDQLQELEKLGEAELQQTILERVSDVMITYYDMVQQQQQLAALDSTLVISEQRLELAQNRFTIGKSSKLEVLNAQVDMNTDRTEMLRQQEQYRNTMIRLNQILARDPQIIFEVIEDFEVDQDLFLPELEAMALQQNPTLQAQVINNNIAKLELKQVKAGRYPSLVATTKLPV